MRFCALSCTGFPCRREGRFMSVTVRDWHFAINERYTKSFAEYLGEQFENFEELVKADWSAGSNCLDALVWNVFFGGFGNLGATTWDWPGPPNCAFQQQANKLTLWAEKHLWISIGTNHVNYASCIDHDWMFSTWHHLGMAWNRLKVQLMPSLKFASKTWYLNPFGFVIRDINPSCWPENRSWNRWNLKLRSQKQLGLRAPEHFDDGIQYAKMAKFASAKLH